MIDMLIIVEQCFLYLPLLIGAYISFSLMKIPDLSLESAYLMGALFGGTTVLYNNNIPTCLVALSAVLTSIAGGMLVGLVSSGITHFGNIPHLLSSIITFGIFHGVFQLFAAPYTSLSARSNSLAIFEIIPHHPELIMLMIIGLIIFAAFFYFLRTQFGYCLAIFGYNPLFFQHYAISTPFIFITGIVMANGLAGLGGYLFAQTNNLIELNLGTGKALFCITALILGKAFISKKTPSAGVPVLGCVLYFFLQHILLKSGFNLKYFTTVQSLVVLIMVLCIYKRAHKSVGNLGV